MSVKGGVCDHEAYESKKIKIFFLLCEHIANDVCSSLFVHIYTTALRAPGKFLIKLSVSLALSLSSLPPLPPT